MALDYFAPGVYVEEVDRGSRPIEGVSMSVAGFVGFTEDVRGDAELFQPVLVTNWGQYLEYFSKPGSQHPGFTTFDAYLPFAVKGWFDNGGGRCWVVSIGTTEPTPAATAAATAAAAALPPVPMPLTRMLSSGKKPSLGFTLKVPDAAASGQLALPASTERVRIIVQESTPLPPATTPEGTEQQGTEQPFDTGEFFTVIIRSGGPEERHEHLTMNPQVAPTVGTYAVTALAESEHVAVQDLSERGQPLTRRPMNGNYEVAPPPYVGTQARLNQDIQGVRSDRRGIQGLFEVDEVAMVACPDLMRAYEKGWMDLDQVHGIMEAMISLCENSAPGPAYRMAVIDPPPVKPNKGNLLVPPEQQKPQDVAQWLRDFNRRSMFGALYYPWIKVPNPRNNGRPIFVPPCGHMMGIWCRTDESRGVFKAPANETPRGVIGLAYETNMREQEMLNPVGINCIRNFANYSRGYKVWGARTLVEPDNVQWRYISVRRLISYIEKSIEIGTQWVVFEPNDQDLWARVNRTVSGFLTRLWRDGALFGASPTDAFYVKCDGELNTPDTMMLGRLYVEVGVCPVRPAEFVIFRISQWAPNQ
jgi:uncharacterized protein